MNSIVKIKKAKLSSKRQITLPKSFLDAIGITGGGQNILIKLVNGKIEIENHQQAFKDKLENYHPIKLKSNKTVDFSQTHNDIYE